MAFFLKIKVEVPEMNSISGIEMTKKKRADADLSVELFLFTFLAMIVDPNFNRGKRKGKDNLLNKMPPST